MKNQNPIEILSKDVKYFDAQNSIIGSLIRKVKHWEKKDFSKFLEKAPDIRDLEIRERLKKLHERDEFFNWGNDDDNNNNNNNKNNFIPRPRLPHAEFPRQNFPLSLPQPPNTT